MRKAMIGVFVCAAALFVFQGTADRTALAQGKKDTKKAAVGAIEIKEGKDGKFRFTVRDGEGKFLANSAAHATEKDAKAAVEEFKEVISGAKVVMLKKDAGDDKKKVDEKKKKDDK